ncbi:glycosyltransferase [Pelagicoccus enzymogenes]|uniref:glycosyltransferase family 2 protein n=1 Tax=Pelagicoccus enzymogenes TaxID=2773457 RepID=UPI00280F1C11|nr:glycosyltransferase [Pelagicoccus enzymogenes]MDQ8199164.1 glycosyltransferase [Pelagicoccus enzymogenes]
MMSPTLSIVIPNYNHGTYLEQCIRSQMGSRLSIEIIIVDDASSDNSIDVIKSLQLEGLPIRFFKNKERLGVVPTMNRGISESKGEYIILRAADDLSEASTFSQAIELLESNREAGLSCGDLAYFLNSPEDAAVETLSLSASPAYLSPTQLHGMLGTSPIHSHTAIYRKSLLQRHGLFKSEHRFYSDWYTTLCLACSHGVCYQPKPTAYARLCSTSYANAGSRNATDRATTLKVLTEDLSILPEQLKTDIYHSRALDFFEIDPKNAFNFPFPPCPIPDDRFFLAGMGGTLYRKLKSLDKTRLTYPAYIYGAGAHTDILLKAWNALNLPKPTRIWVSSLENTRTSIQGIEVRKFGDAFDKIGTIIISSKSYEPEMLSTASTRFPNIPIITFWGSGDKT